MFLCPLVLYPREILKSEMRVCLFGSYIKDSFGIPSGNGGTLLKKILETQDINVVECHEPINNFYSFFKAYVKLFFRHLKLKYDVIIIPWRGILTLPLAKLIHRGPIVYFPAMSIYDTLVNDRKTLKNNSLKARIIHSADKLACKMVDLIVLESSEEINYFVKEFGLPKEKFKQLSLPADESIFFPLSFKKSSNKLIVLFWGSFIPLHGIETIVTAAAMVKKYNDILFKICGAGQTKPQIENMIQKNNVVNVQLLGLVSKEMLLENLKNCDICLGIFGSSAKARKVVTNKTTQALASKKPVITMESPATIEIHLKSGINSILVPPSNPKRLAEAILFMKNNPEKRQQIATAGHQTYLEHLTMSEAGKRLIRFMQELYKNR